ncbi:hypothetical protein ACLB2K_051057 [Fragaria x ananassa]
MDDRTLVSGNGDEKPQFPPLAGQGSNYNLILDRNEVESNLGNMSKPLNTSMAHLDEFLKNVISVDQEGQLVQHPSSSSCSSLPTSLFLGNFNLNGPLMSTTKKKTIDEVWKETAHHDHRSLNLNSAAAHDSLHHQRMTTIGEPTTETTPPEHLLVRAGILNAHPLMPIDPEAVVPQQADWFQFQVAADAQQMTMLDSNFTVCESVFENSSSVMNIDSFSENHLVGMSIPLPAISAASSSESQATHAERKRNYSDEMKEKNIERRQKRMIKNRESAARSRARKQAYTNHLEGKVSHLEKMNTWLKKQKFRSLSKRNQQKRAQYEFSANCLISTFNRNFRDLICSCTPSASVQMETKKSNGVEVIGEVWLLTYAWDVLATLLTSAVLSLAQEPFQLPACGPKNRLANENEYSYSEAVDGDEEKNNDGGLGDTEEELSSEDEAGAGNSNGKSNNSSKAGAGGDGGEVGKEGEADEDEDDINNRDDNDDGEVDGDEDKDEDEDNKDDDEVEENEEEEIIAEEEPDDEEDEEEEALQPPKKRKK